MISKIQNSFSQKRTRVILGGIAVIIIAFVLLGGDDAAENTAVTNAYPQVSLATVASLSSEGPISLIGSVESVDEARLEAEASGRITSVSVAIGDTVYAGQVIAQIENSSEYAALLQAEGAYEAALAANTGTTIDAVSTYKGTYITIDSIVRNTVDDHFTSPNSRNPGLRLDGRGDAYLLVKERVAIEDILDELSTKQSTVTAGNVEAELRTLREATVRISSFVEDIAYLISRQDTSEYFTQADKDGYEADILRARTSLSTAVQNIDGALNDVAESKSGTSTNDAKVKQALGALKAAQASYNKTVIQTPIAGTVNSVSVKTGDYANAFDAIATIANNNALKVTAYVNKSEATRIETDTVVTIEGVGEGRISRVAPAIDAATGKVKIEIQTESTSLQNGDVVSLKILPTDVKEVDTVPSVTRIPLTAVKLSVDAASVFTIEEDRLVAHPVTLGKVQSDMVEIIEGIDPAWDIVLDARGLSAGQQIRIAE